MLFRTNNVTSVAKLLMNKEKPISGNTAKRKLISIFLSPYERVQIILFDAESTLDSEPYETYQLLKSQKIDTWQDADKDFYYKLMSASLFYLGAMKEAGALAEKFYEKNSDDVLICSILCVIYNQAGQTKKAIMMAEQAYQIMISEPKKLNYNYAQVYNNYACALIWENRIDRGLDIARDGIKAALNGKDESMIHLAVANYLKLLWRYRGDCTLIETVLEQYKSALNQPEDTCIEYINCQLILMHSGYKTKNLEEYIRKIYIKNVPDMQGEEKCFFSLSCINVAWSHSVDVKEYFDDPIKLLCDECKQLNMISRVRFFNQIMTFVIYYPEHCRVNGFTLDKRYQTVADLVMQYLNNEAIEDTENALAETDSICMNQKCELRRIMIDFKRQKNHVVLMKLLSCIRTFIGNMRQWEQSCRCWMLHYRRLMSVILKLKIALSLQRRCVRLSRTNHWN